MAEQLTPAQKKENEMLKLADPIIVKGFKEDLEENAIKTQLAVAGIEFTAINRIFKKVAIGRNLIVDPVVVKENIETVVAESDWEELKSFEQFQEICEDIADEVDGATLAKVMRIAEDFLKEQDIDVPSKKTTKATRAKGGKAARAILDLFAKNSKATKAEAYEAVLPCGKAHKNAVDNLKIHYMVAFGCANGMTADEAFEATKDEPWPAEPETQVEDTSEESED